MLSPKRLFSVSEVKDAHRTLLQAEQRRTSGDLARAQELCQELIERYPDYAAALGTLGLIHVQRGAYSSALPHLARAAMYDPHDRVVLSNLAKSYMQLGGGSRAISILERSLEQAPDQFQTLHLLGSALALQGRYKQGAQVLERACAMRPEGSDAHIWLSECYVNTGRHEDAAAALAKGFEAPLTRNSKAFACRIASGLPREVDPGFNVLEVIGSLGGQQPEDNAYTLAGLPFARASYLEKLGRHKEAWDLLVTANAPLAEKYETDLQSYRDHIEELKARCLNWTPSGSGAAAAKGDTPLSLFILGPSRSGKTTLERLTGSLPGVEMLEERDLVRSTARHVSQSAGLLAMHHLSTLPHKLNPRIAETYTARLRKLAGKADAVTITEPGIITDAGRILDCGINARFVFMTRDEDEIALRMFGKLYQENSNAYAYDLAAIYRYISDYRAMIDAWLEKLGGRAILVSYEEMVEKPDAVLRQVACLCGLKASANPGIRVDDDRGCAEPYRAWLHAARHDR